MTKRTATKTGTSFGYVLVIAALAVLAFFAWRQFGTPETAPEPGEPLAEEAGPSAPAYPVDWIQTKETGPDDEPLPALGESDEAALTAIAALAGGESAPAVVLPEHIVERLVATIDNLPNRKLAPRLLPVRPAAGGFRVLDDADGTTTIDPRNFSRYQAYVDLIEAVDTDALMAQYVRAYPLLQQAYRELGYPDGHFNDRLIAVIDHLLAAPSPSLPIALAPEKGQYAYADPALQSLSAGHKILVRIGPDNAAVVKAKLRELREALAGQSPAPDEADPVAPEDEATGQ